jgi:hypothetical protein
MAAKFAVFISRPHRFEDARDAIDAVSTFESSTELFWEYHIEPVGSAGGKWTVRAVQVDGGVDRGWLNPVEG